MNRAIRIGIVAGVLTAGVVLGASRADEPKAGQAACFARMKKLVGDWVRKDPQGKEHLVARWRSISGGTALEETLLPGAQEMVSIYHMDGDNLVMTHYCSMGNQPHLKATAASTPAKIEFVCTGKGGNMKSENDMHIHHALFTLTADDNFSTAWGANKDGKNAGDDAVFTFTRKK